MPPSRALIHIHTAGTVPLPPSFPELGLLGLTKLDGDETYLQIEQHDSLYQTNRYVVLPSEVSAILVAKAGKLDPKTDQWLLGQEDISELLNTLKQPAAKKPARRESIAKEADPERAAEPDGYIVFVRESVGILVQTERGVAAGEIGHPARGCEECRGKGCEEC